MKPSKTVFRLGLLIVLVVACNKILSKNESTHKTKNVASKVIKNKKQQLKLRNLSSAVINKVLNLQRPIDYINLSSDNAHDIWVQTKYEKAFIISGVLYKGKISEYRISLNVGFDKNTNKKNIEKLKKIAGSGPVNKIIDSVIKAKEENFFDSHILIDGDIIQKERNVLEIVKKKPHFFYKEAYEYCMKMINASQIVSPYRTNILSIGIHDKTLVFSMNLFNGYKEMISVLGPELLSHFPHCKEYAKFDSYEIRIGSDSIAGKRKDGSVWLSK